MESNYTETDNMQSAGTIDNTVQKKGIPGSTLKIIAIVVMFIDHVAAVVLDNYILSLYKQGNYDYINIYYIDMLMRLIGRLGFPIFCFLLVEGFSHTHNKWKYLRNLFIFALISEIPFNLAIDAKFFSTAHQSVFCTLFFGLLALIGIKWAMERENWNNICKIVSYPAYFIAGPVVLYFVSKWISAYGAPVLNLRSDWLMYLIAGVISTVFLLLFFRNKTADEKASLGIAMYCGMAAIIAAEILKTDYSGSGVIVIIAMYAFRKYGAVKQGLVGCILLTLMQAVEFTSFFILIPLKHYNGKRGISLKYFFYAFYPVHLTILYLICVLMGTV